LYKPDMQDLDQIKAEFKADLESADSTEKLEQVRIHYLGKSGIITARMKLMASLSPEEKKQFGAQINDIKKFITEAIDTKKTVLESESLNSRLANESIDITLPAREEIQGKIHPVSRVLEEVTAILSGMGFSTAEGPDIEDDYHNFTALNIPENHPARDMHDTFYLPGDGERMVLRTHTSPVQIRAMQAGKPPFRIIAAGRTYRSDSDVTHSPMFHQVEGLYVDKGVSMAHLKGCLLEFLRAFFETDVRLRFRPSFFPFTEPSAEVDIGCSRGNGELKIGAGNNWLEILGCGMVHPNVLSNCGIDPEEYSGFAFGMGVERLAMLKYGIADLRTFFESDVRWLKHYGFAPL